MFDQCWPTVYDVGPTLARCVVFDGVTYYRGRRNRDRDPLGVTSDLVELQERWDAKQLAVRRLEQLQQQKPDPHLAFLLAVANKEVPAGTVWRKDTAAMVRFTLLLSNTIIQ